MSIPDTVSVPPVWASGATIYDTIHNPADGQKYAVLRGKTLSDGDFVFKIKWAYGTKGDDGSEFYFINVVTRKKAWVLPDLGPQAVSETLLAAIGKQVIESEKQQQQQQSPSSPSARPAAPTQEIVSNPASPGVTNASLDAAFASPQAARATGAGGANFNDDASPRRAGAAAVPPVGGSAGLSALRRAASGSPPPRSLQPQQQQQQQAISEPEARPPVSQQQQQQAALPAPAPQDRTASSNSNFTGEAQAASVVASSYAGLDEKDILDVPLLKYELARLTQSLQDRDQVIAQFQNSFATHQTAIKQLKHEVKRLREASSQSPVRERSPQNAAATSANTEQKQQGESDEIAHLKKELAAVRHALELEQEKNQNANVSSAAAIRDKDELISKLRKHVDAELERNIGLEKRLSNCKSESAKELETVKRALEHEQEKTLSLSRMLEANNDELNNKNQQAEQQQNQQQLEADLTSERARIAKIEAILSEVELSSLIRVASTGSGMDATSSSSAGNTILLRIPSAASSSASSPGPSGLKHDVVDMVREAAAEILALRKENKELRRDQERLASAAITVTPASPPKSNLDVPAQSNSPNVAAAIIADRLSWRILAAEQLAENFLLQKNVLWFASSAAARPEQRASPSAAVAQQSATTSTTSSTSRALHQALESSVRFRELLAAHFVQQKQLELDRSGVVLASSPPVKPKRPGSWNNSPPPSPRGRASTQSPEQLAEAEQQSAARIAAAVARHVQSFLQSVETRASLVHEQKQMLLSESAAAI